METRDILELVIVVMGGVTAIGYAFGQFRQGQSNRRKDDVQGKRGTLELLQEQLDSLEKLCAKQQEEIVEMRTRADEREKKAQEYVSIFQNRNPEMLAFMKYLTETANLANTYMKDTSVLLSQLSPVLEKIEHHLAIESQP